jgi:FtsP/CotA-like multicopper oxidase with cupredoxin domain
MQNHRRGDLSKLIETSSGPSKDAATRRYVQKKDYGRHTQLTPTAAASFKGWLPEERSPLSTGAHIPAFGETAHQTSATLTGNHFDLTIDYLPVNFTGKHRIATAVNGSVPGPTLRWCEGETVTLAVTNHLKRLPPFIDTRSVCPRAWTEFPGLSFPGIKPHETFIYRMPVVRSGTYWYHSHTGSWNRPG